MDSPDSFAYLFVWVVVIQSAILALVGLFLVYRRFRQTSRFHLPDGSAVTSSFRHPYLLGGGLAGAVFMGGLAYHFILSGETPWYEHYHPRTRTDTPLSQPRRTDNGNGWREPSPQNRPSEDIKARAEGGASTVRDAVRRSLKGGPPAEKNGLQASDPVLHTYLGLINKWRSESKEALHGHALTADSVYDRLTTQYGFKGDRSLVDTYLSQEAPFIPEGCGRGAVVDWISVPLALRAEEDRVMCLYMTSAWSGRYVMFCYRCDNLASFLDAQMRAFDFFGGVFPDLIYRALSGPMADRLGKVDSPQRHIFEQFCRIYHVTPDFRQIDEGPDLTAREGRLRDLFSQQPRPEDRWNDLDQLNRALLESASTRTVGRGKALDRVCRQEALCLLPFPNPRFENVVQFKTAAATPGVVDVEGIPYAVPKRYAGREVEVAVFFDRVEIFHGPGMIASHLRRCETDGRVSDYRHD